MSKNNQVVKVYRSGMGPLTTLTLVFIIIKVLGLADISWWVVFAPLWAPVVVFLSVMLLIIVIGWVALWISDLKRRKRNN